MGNSIGRLPANVARHSFSLFFRAIHYITGGLDMNTDHFVGAVPFKYAGAAEFNNRKGIDELIVNPLPSMATVTSGTTFPSGNT